VGVADNAFVTCGINEWHYRHVIRRFKNNLRCRKFKINKTDICVLEIDEPNDNLSVGWLLI